jgi:histidine triad (HIT) family protein
MNTCVFCKIRDGVIEKKFDYEDKDVMVFPDINPAKPVHILIVPKKHIEDFIDLQDSKLIIKIKKTIDYVVKKNLKHKGYRVLVNGGGAQIINHLHFHIIGPIDKNLSI